MPALLSQTQTGVALTSSQVINQTLPAGFRLSGKISGSGQPTFILAQSDANGTFSGRVDNASGKYLIVVPAGSYSIKLCYQPSSQTAARTICTFSDTDVVPVSADTAHDITLPATSLFKISGTISGLNNLVPSPKSLEGQFNSDGAQGVFTVDSSGSYQGLLPAGSYVASIGAGLQFSLLQSETLGIYSIGSITVSGDVSGANFSVPSTARLSGTVQGPSLVLPMVATSITAADTSAPQVSQVACAYPRTTSSIPADPLTGQYQLLLAGGRT